MLFWLLIFYWFDLSIKDSGALKSLDYLKSHICIIADRLHNEASLVAQMVKNLPAMQETWVQSLDWKDPPEKEMATHSSILA